MTVIYSLLFAPVSLSSLPYISLAHLFVSTPFFLYFCVVIDNTACGNSLI